MMRSIFLSVFLFVVNTALAQPMRENPVIVNMRADVTYLASDELEGRATGSKAEELAAKYISERWMKVGLKPAGVKDV